jgi:hypothetical protein
VRLLPALDTDRFAEAERSVLRLDGDCVPLGLTVVPVDVPVVPEVRAASLRPAVLRHDLVVDRRTAAWVHGVVPALPKPLTLAVDVRRTGRTRAIVPPPREAHLRPADVERLGGVLVTTPLKTAFDLLRLPASLDDATAAAARGLLDVAGLTPPIAAALAHLQIACPHKQRGIARLAAL